MKRLTSFVCALALLAGCAIDGANLRPGATEAEVRQSMGPPRMELRDADGSRVLIYPHGPLGTTTLIADIDRSGHLVRVRQVLGEDSFYRVQPGMTRDQILRLIGPPGDTMRFALSGNEAWDYRFMDAWGYLAIFSVTFDSRGIVVSKFTKRIERDTGFR